MRSNELYVGESESVKIKSNKHQSKNLSKVIITTGTESKAACLNFREKMILIVQIKK